MRLWYLPENEADWNFFHDISNDSNLIHYQGYSKEKMIKIFHEKSMEWYNNLPEVDVMITHVPPIPYHLSNHSKTNGCYVMKVTSLKAPHWICGHSHDVGITEKAGTKFYWNCFGYPNERKESRIHMFEL